MLIPVVISGGAGARLWPLSRTHYPKPFLTLPNGGTLIGKTYERAAKLDGCTHILTVTNRDLLFLTVSAWEEANIGTCDHSFLLEPVGRNTAAAVAFASLHVQQLYGPETCLIVMPSDHLIQDEAALEHAVKDAKALAHAGRIVTFGIVPDRAETGYGYIELIEGSVAGFVEKPDAATAELYCSGGRHYWNSGLFCFTAGGMIEAMESHCPDILVGTRAAFDDAIVGQSGGYKTLEAASDSFKALTKTSIDYAVMEKTDRISCIPVDCGWSDVGTWSVIADMVEADEEGNSVVGAPLLMDNVQNCFVHAQERIVGLVGVSDLIVVDTPDALLVAGRSESQKVRSLFDQLESQGHDAAVLHQTVYRPWGSYTILEEKPGFKIKRIEVKPNERLSLQSHKHRSEHWVVVSGVARVTNNDQIVDLSVSESTYIPQGNQHRLENLGTEPLVLIEVQCGSYLGEDDIIRYDDIYGRT